MTVDTKNKAAVYLQNILPKIMTNSALLKAGSLPLFWPILLKDKNLPRSLRYGRKLSYTMRDINCFHFIFTLNKQVCDYKS